MTMVLSLLGMEGVDNVALIDSEFIIKQYCSRFTFCYFPQWLDTGKDVVEERGGGLVV